MNDAIEPAVWNFAGDEDASGAQDAMDFGEGTILEAGGLEMVQDENGYGAGEGAICEGQGRGDALHYTGALPAVREFLCGPVIVLQAGYSRRATQQLAGGSSGPCADFEDVLAELHVGQKPGQ